jgi:hypothetical protein
VDTGPGTQQALPPVVAEARPEGEKLDSAQAAGEVTVLTAPRLLDPQVPFLAPSASPVLIPTSQRKDIVLVLAGPSPWVTAAQMSPAKLEPQPHWLPAVGRAVGKQEVETQIDLRGESTRSFQKPCLACWRESPGQGRPRSGPRCQHAPRK